MTAISLGQLLLRLGCAGAPGAAAAAARTVARAARSSRPGGPATTASPRSLAAVAGAEGVRNCAIAASGSAAAGQGPREASGRDAPSWRARHSRRPACPGAPAPLAAGTPALTGAQLPGVAATALWPRQQQQWAWHSTLGGGAAEGAAHEQQQQQQQHERTEPVASLVSAHQLIGELRQMGLTQPAAVAVHQAWLAGFQSSALKFWGHMPERRRQPQTSLARLRARVRRLLRAHAAAAAEAHAAQAAGDPGGADAGAGGGGGLSWGALEIQQLLVSDPCLLVVPPAHLAARLGELLTGLSRILPPAAALAFVHACAQLSHRLGEPARTWEQLSGMQAAYQEVLGVAPRPGLLANARSSYFRNRLPTLKSKLQDLADRYGREAVHAAVSRQPHLLSSSAAALLENGRVVQEMLSLSDQDMRRAVAAAPRLLNSQPSLLRANLQRLKQQLAGVGFTEQQTASLLLRFPLLMLQSPITLSSKVEGIKELLGPAAPRLQHVLRSQPTVLTSRLDHMRERLEGLQELLGVSRDRACRLVAQNSSLLSLSRVKMQRRIDEHAEVLGVSPAQLAGMCRADPQILVLAPSNLDSKLTHLCGAMGWRREDLMAAVLQSNSRVLLYDATLVAAYCGLLTKLVSQSALWGRLGRAPPVDGGGGQRSRRPARGRPPCWQVHYARTVSGRLPLRLEYLLSTGRQEEVGLATANKAAAAPWDARFPDFGSWVNVRLALLQQEPGDWAPALVGKAAAAMAAAATRRASAPGAAPPAPVPRARRQPAGAAAAAGSDGWEQGGPAALSPLLRDEEEEQQQQQLDIGRGLLSATAHHQHHAPPASPAAVSATLPGTV